MEVKEIIDVKSLIDYKNYTYKTILSLIILLAGLLFYFYWGITYGKWFDIGIYSITIFLVLLGIFGMMLSLIEDKEEE